MSIIKDFFSYLSSKNKKVVNDESHSTVVDNLKNLPSFLNKKETPLIDMIENYKHQNGLYLEDAIFVLINNILRGSYPLEEYVLKKLTKINENTLESMSYFSKTKKLRVFWYNLSDEKRKQITDYFIFVEKNISYEDKQKYLKWHMKSAISFFRSVKKELLNEESREVIKNLFLSLIKTNEDLKLFYSISESRYFSMMVLPENFIDMCYLNFSKKDKIEYEQSTMKNAIKEKKRYFNKSFYSYKENVNLYIKFLKFAENSSEKYYPSERQELRESGIYLYKEFVKEIYPKNNFNNIIDGEENNLFLNITNSLFANDEQELDEKIIFYKETIDYIKENLKNNENIIISRDNDGNFFNDIKEMDDEKSLKLIDLHLETYSELKEITKNFSDYYHKKMITELLEVIDGKDFIYKMDVINIINKNDNIDENIKNEILSNIIKVPKGYFNIEYGKLLNIIELYKCCLKNKNYNNNELLNKLFEMKELNNGYLYHDIKKSNLMLKLASKRPEIAEKIIFNLIKFNAIYKKEDEIDEKTLKDYKELKESIVLFMKENKLSFSMKEIFKSDFFTKNYLTLRTIIDFNEFENDREYDVSILTSSPP